MPTYINGSEAWRLIVKLGYDVSYPTTLKWLRENGLARQITGKYGTIIIDKDLLEKTLKTKKKVKIEERKTPGRKKSVIPIIK